MLILRELNNTLVPFSVIIANFKNDWMSQMLSVCCTGAENLFLWDEFDLSSKTIC